MNDTFAGRGVALAWRGLVDPLSTPVLSSSSAQRHVGLTPPSGPNARLDLVERLADGLAQPDTTP